MPEVTIGRRLALLIALGIVAATLVVLAIVKPDLAAQLIDGLFGVADNVNPLGK